MSDVVLSLRIVKSDSKEISDILAITLPELSEEKLTEACEQFFTSQLSLLIDSVIHRAYAQPEPESPQTDASSAEIKP